MARILAFYLPQYYPTPTNDKWYGTGFTEWTNVGKAVPLFHNHYQPHVPADLGYYDLRNSDTQVRQAELAKSAGIEGFVYYHYWFGNGDMELEQPLEGILRSGRPDFPFCICWANQSWYSKFWNSDINCEARLIKEQRYDDEAGIEAHFMSLKRAFEDKRHIKISGRLLFMIYRPLEYPGLKQFMDIFNRLAHQYLGTTFYFVGQATSDGDAAACLAAGMDGVNIVRLGDYRRSWKYNNLFRLARDKFLRLMGFAPYHYQYRNISRYFVDQDGIEKEERVFPTIIPNWDHSPRSGKRGLVLHDSTPEYFARHVRTALDTVAHKSDESNLIFLKSWNEWGEGNYMEPDLKFGHGYINALRECLDQDSQR